MTDFNQAKAVHIKEINKEIRQGYTNQSVFRLLDLISDLCFSATLSKDATFSKVAFEVAEYARTLRDFQKHIVGVPTMKSKAKHLLQVTAMWKGNQL